MPSHLDKIASTIWLQNGVLTIISHTFLWGKERDGVLNHRRLDCLSQPFVYAKIKESIKAPRHWPLWGESTGDRWIPPPPPPP